MTGFPAYVARVLFTVLFVLVPILGVWTFVTADDYGWWFPQNVSTFGPKIDALFDLILWMVAFTFVLTEGALVWCVYWYSKPRTSKAVFSHGNHKLEMVWTAVPAVLLLVIAFAQMGTWAEIKFTANMGLDENGEPGQYTVEAPMMEIYASQFDWRARYPDRDGNFNGIDVVESPYDIYVPVDTPVVFHLKSRDVLHAFFVPQFRLKQDAVPGMTIPVWFNAQEVGSYDLICAELCGWGHYKMAGRVHVLPKDEYEAWLEGQREALYANGSADLAE
ncbi:MAG: cytochrome c oxidase subunit II [Planctomycetota bacterium]